jgi:uncharacterized protein YjiS (DUF1127 family)
MTAIHLQPCHEAVHGSRRHAALDALSDATHWAFDTMSEWRRRARERAELASLDNRMLQDIGLTRGDAEFLANKPFWRE